MAFIIMHMYLYLLFIIVGGSLMLSGCKNQSNNGLTSDSVAHLVSSNRCFTAVTNWQEVAKINEYFSFELTLKESCVNASQIVSVSVYADMPAHGHGTNSQPVVKKIAPFVYRIEGMLLHMPGNWRVAAEVNYMHQQQPVIQQQLETMSFNATL